MKHCPRCSAPVNGRSWECSACGFVPPRFEGYPALAPELATGGAEFPADAYPELATLEAQNFWFRARNHLIVWALRHHFPTMGRFLEIGCGTGFVLSGVAEAFPAAELTGTDAFSVGLAYAARRVPGAEVHQMDARRIPYRNEFDVVGAFDVLEHIEQDETVLQQMNVALRPGGGIALTVPQHPWLWSRQDELACHVRRYRVQELHDKVQRAGFVVDYQTSFVSFLLPAMIGSRMVSGRKSSDADALSELRLSKPVNMFLEGVMSVERQAVRLGMTLPIGASQLLIARRPME